MTIQERLDRVITEATSGWDEPIDQVHDAPQIRNALLAHFYITTNGREL